MEDRTLDFLEGILPGFALKGLDPFGGLANLINALLLTSLQFTVLGTIFIWTKIAALSKPFPWISLPSVYIWR
jgi:hypothetical protein